MSLTWYIEDGKSTFVTADYKSVIALHGEQLTLRDGIDPRKSWASSFEGPIWLTFAFGLCFEAFFGHIFRILCNN